MKNYGGKSFLPNFCGNAVGLSKTEKSIFEDCLLGQHFCTNKACLF